MLLLWGAPHTLAAWSPHEPIRLSTKITTARRWQGGEKVKERAVQRLFSPSPLGSNTEEGTRKQWYVVPHEPLLPEAGRRGEIISSRLQCSRAFNMIGGGGDRSIGIAKCSRDWRVLPPTKAKTCWRMRELQDPPRLQGHTSPR